MQKRKVEVVPYRKEWVEIFQKEKKRILRMIDSSRIVLHHIGSTSVPGLSAKPIIDLLAEVDEIMIFNQFASKMEEEGYIAKGENGIAGRRFFIKFNEQGEHIVHLHAFQKGSPEIGRHLAFRDYLRSHREDRERYREVKETAAKKFPFDIEGYMNYKDPIIKEIEGKALMIKKDGPSE